MPKATFDSAYTLNPVQAAAIVISSTKIDHIAKAVLVTFDFTRADGTTIGSASRQLNGPVVATWIANQENLLLTRLLAALNVTGVIA